MGLQTFYGKGPQPLLWAISRAAREKIISGLPRRRNYFVTVVAYILTIYVHTWSLAAQYNLAGRRLEIHAIELSWAALFIRSYQTRVRVLAV